MKKPKITPGQWRYDEENKRVNSFSPDGENLICEVDYCGQDPFEEKANAKAISATPEMIDALIEARESLEIWIQTYASEFCAASDVIKSKKKISEGGGTLAYIGDRIEKIEQALLKSGCADEGKKHGLVSSVRNAPEPDIG